MAVATPVVPVPGRTGTVASGVSASRNVTDLGAGSHTLRAVYSGDDRFEAGSSGAVTVTVAKLATTLTPQAALVSVSPLGLPLGQLKVTLTAGGDPLAGAPVEFKVGTKVVCQATTNARGVAACNASSQVLGLVLNGGYTASYAGDADHLPTSVRGGILK